MAVIGIPICATDKSSSCSGIFANCIQRHSGGGNSLHSVGVSSHGRHSRLRCCHGRHSRLRCCHGGHVGKVGRIKTSQRSDGLAHNGTTGPGEGRPCGRVGLHFLDGGGIFPDCRHRNIRFRYRRHSRLRCCHGRHSRLMRRKILPRYV